MHRASPIRRVMEKFLLTFKARSIEYAPLSRIFQGEAGQPAEKL
jgi:hypothetical protein